MLCGPPGGWSHSPYAQRGLDEGGDSHAGEDGAYELADRVLVAAHTQRLSQEERHCNGAAEAGQVVLGAGSGHMHPGLGSSQGKEGTLTALRPAWWA